MVIALLENGGTASVRDIATNILFHDESQIECYEHITEEMAGQVLRQWAVVMKEEKAFELLMAADFIINRFIQGFQS